jgi:hypothetical protein
MRRLEVNVHTAKAQLDEDDLTCLEEGFPSGAVQGERYAPEKVLNG